MMNFALKMMDSVLKICEFWKGRHDQSFCKYTMPTYNLNSRDSSESLLVLSGVPSMCLQRSMPAPKGVH